MALRALVRVDQEDQAVAVAVLVADLEDNLAVQVLQDKVMLEVQDKLQDKLVEAVEDLVL
jgi:hypothetical protein